MTDRIFVAGHRGLVGSAIVRALRNAGFQEPLTRSRAELDLRDKGSVASFFSDGKPDVVFLAAARVGGIVANNTQRWDFIHDNLVIEANVIGAAHEAGVRRVVFFGSSCIYPRDAPQPMREEHLLTGPLEPTNEPYAIAKIAGVKLVEAAVAQFGHRWISLMPTNLYGPNDNFDARTSHVLPALIAKFHTTKTAEGLGGSQRLVLWGDGSPLREFLHVDDLAQAALAVIESDDVGMYNVGSAEEISIRALAELVNDVSGARVQIDWDPSQPNGSPRKLLDSKRFREMTGWRPTIMLREGVASTYAWYADSQAPQS